jgi:peptidyl-prolyl cis-trans isomerase A (cyclophilin A)
LKNVAGAIAMARTSDPDSATSQFFINTVKNSFLDPGTQNPDGYAVFGMVVTGMDVVHAIENVPTDTVSGWEDAPVDNVVMTKVKVEQK